MDNVAKKIVCLDSGKIFGYVLAPAFDFELLEHTGYYVVEQDTEVEFFLKNENISKIAQDFVVIEKENNLQFYDFPREQLFGKSVVDCDGRFYGVVQKIYLQKNKIVKLATDRCEICRKNIKCVKQDVVVASFASRRKKIVNIENVEQLKNIEVKIQKTLQNCIPGKANLSMDFCLGKTILEDVIGLNHERIANSGEKVTKAILQRAKKHNKTNELFFAVEK